LLVLTDNAGFGNPATFGGPIRTPALDRLAAGGLRYNGFHVTAMCSPARPGLGEQFDAEMLEAYPPGSVIVLPGGTRTSTGRDPASTSRRLRRSGFWPSST